MSLKQASPLLRVPVSDRDHSLGRPDAPLALVEYGDYQCAHCGKVHSFVEQVRQDYGDRLRFVYRHFPLTKMHNHARLAAEVAEAAAAQGKFWEMHHSLLTHQQELDPAHLLGHAQAVGLDVERVRREVEAHAYAGRVQEDVTGGVRSGVNGAPTFFVNGRRLDGGYELADLLHGLETAEAGATGGGTGGNA